MLENDIELRFNFALKLVKELEESLTRDFYNFPINTHKLKDDNSYLTNVDISVENYLTNKIKSKFKDDFIIGEELNPFSKVKLNGFTWTLDPIDGTSSFVLGALLFGSLIGVLHNNNPVIGIIGFPPLKIICYAILNKGAFWTNPAIKGRWLPCHANNNYSFDKCIFSYSAREYFLRSNKLDLLDFLSNNFKLERVWGDCFGHFLVAIGKIDIMIDPILKIWDFVPIELIINESGASFKCLNNKDGLSKESGISGNKNLIDKVLLKYKGLVNRPLI